MASLTFERIVLVAPNWLGDAVMALPALAALRATCPGATLLAAGRASTVPLFSMVPGIDEVVRLDSRGGIVGAISWAEDAAALRGARAGLAVLLPNSFRSAWTAHRAGIGERWGYAADLRSRLLTRVVPRLRRPYHMTEYYLHLVSQLTSAEQGGGVEQGRGAEPGFSDALKGSPEGLPHNNPGEGGLPHTPKITAPPEAQQRADELLGRLGLGSGSVLVGMAPGAAYGKAKQWPPERFAALAVDLHQRLGATSLLFGAKSDRMATAVVARRAGGQKPGGYTLQDEASARQRSGGDTRPAVVDLAGQTDLPLLVALMARCRSVVSNDSGAMHVAAAAGVPVTAIFGATNEHHTAPLRCDAAPVAPHEILTSPVWCRPCMLRECPLDHRCMRRIDAAAAAAAVERQIGRKREDRIQKTEDRRQNTEDRTQKTE